MEGQTNFPKTVIDALQSNLMIQKCVYSHILGVALWTRLCILTYNQKNLGTKGTK